MATSTTTRELAVMVGGRLDGPADLVLTGIGSLEEAGPNDISFLGNEKYRPQVLTSQAGAVLVPEDFDSPPPPGRAWILCEDPSAAFTLAVDLFAPPPATFAPGRHQSAVIHATATVPASAHIGPFSVLAAHVSIGENSVIGAGTYIGEHTHVGGDCLLYPNVTVRERCVIGNRVVIHSGTTIGSDGFGFIPGTEKHIKIPQVGIVQIDDDVEIGAQVAVDRARFGRTWIRRGSKIDNLVQIAHNVVIGENCLIVAQVGISGSAKLRDGVVVAGQAGIGGHLEIGQGTIVMGRAAVTKSLPAGAKVFGIPALPYKEYAKTQMAIKRLATLQATVKQLQREISELRAGGRELDEQAHGE